MTSANINADMPAVPFAAWRTCPADNVDMRINNCLHSGSVTSLEEEVAGFVARVERVRAVAQEAASVVSTPRDAALAAAALPRDMCHTHTLSSPRAVSVRVVGDATGDMLTVWPSGTRVTVHVAPRGMDGGWATIQWPEGTTARRYPDGDWAVDELARSEAHLARARARLEWVKAGWASLTPAEQALLTEVASLEGGLCDAALDDVYHRHGVVPPRRLA